MGQLSDSRSESELLGFTFGHHKSRLNQCVQQTVKRGSGQGHALQQIAGRDGAVIDGEGLQDLQSSAHCAYAFRMVFFHDAPDSMVVGQGVGMGWGGRPGAVAKQAANCPSDGQYYHFMEQSSQRA